MDNEINYNCAVKFEDNILVLGITGCGKNNICPKLREKRCLVTLKK